jgi:hypothetical protein
VLARERVALGLLGLFWAVVYLPPLFSARCLPARDVAATQAPWRTVWRDQVEAGHLPLWDPYSNQGRPLLANPNTMALYPGTALFLALDPESASAWHIAAHHLLLLYACYLLARRCGGSAGAAAVAAAATGTTGVAWSLVTLVNSQAALVWTTLAVAAAVPPPTGAMAARRALAGGAALGIAFLAGEPLIAALGAVAWTVVVVATWRPFPKLALPLAAAAAFGLAAPVLLPLLSVYGDTLRATLGVAPGALAADTLAPRRWVELLLPHLLGAPLGDGASGFWAAESFPWQRYFPLVFVGIVPVLTLPFARRAPYRLAHWWTLLALGVGSSMLLAWPVAGRVAAAVPGMDAARYGIKLLLLAFFALPPLVAAGIQRLAERPPRRRRAVAAAVLASAVLVAAAGALAPAAVRSALRRLYPHSAGALASVGDDRLGRSLAGDAAALALPAAALLATGSAAPLCAATLAANYLAGRSLLPFDQARRWSEPPALARALPAGATVAVFAKTAAPADTPGAVSLARFWRARAALVPEYGTRWGLGYTLTRGPDGLEPIRQELLAAAVGRLAPGERAHAARALGAHAVIDDAPIAGLESHAVDGVWLSTLAAAPPRAYLARRELPCDGIPATALALAAEAFRAGDDATVEGAGGALELGGGAIEDLGGPPHRRLFATTTAAPGLLVVRQSFMRCWRARIDGRPARVEAVNGAQLGVRVPAGTHRVEVLVDSRPAWLGIAGALLVLTMIVATRRTAAPSPARPAASGGEGRSTPATPPAP